MYDLIRRCQDGDPAAFDHLYSRFQAVVLRTAYFITRNVQDAEDVVQEAFLDVHRDIFKLREPQRFEAWLRKITVHHSLRKVRTRRAVPLNEIEESVLDAQPVVLSPEEYLGAADQKIMVREALELLSPVQRIVLGLRYFDDLPEREIAHVLGCSIGTVKSRIHYAKRELATVMARMNCSGSVASEMAPRESD